MSYGQCVPNDFANAMVPYQPPPVPPHLNLTALLPETVGRLNVTETLARLQIETLDCDHCVYVFFACCALLILALLLESVPLLVPAGLVCTGCLLCLELYDARFPAGITLAIALAAFCSFVVFFFYDKHCDKQTWLHLASGQEPPCVIRLLIRFGVDVAQTDANNGDGHTALYVACRWDNVEAARQLLRSGANPNKGNEAKRWTPLHLAAMRGHAEIVEELLLAGAAVNRANDIGATPLHLAAFNNEPACVRLLVSAGAKIDARGRVNKDGAGCTPAYLAAMVDSVASLRTLVAAGADVEAPTSRAWRPIHAACETGAVGAVSLLLGAGADRDVAGGPQGTTPLETARNSTKSSPEAKEQLVALLVAEGAPAPATRGARRRRSRVSRRHTAPAAVGGSGDASTPANGEGAGDANGNAAAGDAAASPGDVPAVIVTPAKEASSRAAAPAATARPAEATASLAEADTSPTEAEEAEASPAEASPAARVSAAASPAGAEASSVEASLAAEVSLSSSAASSPGGTRRPSSASSPGGTRRPSLGGLARARRAAGLRPLCGAPLPDAVADEPLPDAPPAAGAPGAARPESDLLRHREELAALRDVLSRRQVPDSLTCPISCDIMLHPVVAGDGHTYEREAIEDWLATGARTSPLTGEPLPSTHLMPNHHARAIIAEFLQGIRDELQGGGGGGAL